MSAGVFEWIALMVMAVCVSAMSCWLISDKNY